MTEKPLVSVIINCYNGEKYLREAIDSVIAQTYENWELVFWDNQSTDSTRDIVESYMNPKIKYFYAPEHTPLGAARNMALCKTLGDYVAFLDCDDIWYDSFLMNGISSITNNNCCGFYSNYHFKSKDGLKENNEDIKEGLHDSKFIISNYQIGMSAAIVDNRVIKKNSIMFNPRYSMIEDYDFFVRLSLLAPFYYSPKPLMYYRRHSQSLSLLKVDCFASEFKDFYETAKKKDGVYSVLDKEELHSVKVTYLKSEAKKCIAKCDRIHLRHVVLGNLRDVKFFWKQALYAFLPECLYLFLYSRYSRERVTE